MSEARAIEKARSLHRFVLSEGAPLHEFALVLTDEEAMGLLDPLAQGELGRFGNHEALELDVEKAKVQHNPWPVLENFQLFGLDIRRALDVLQ